jgi:LAO/AO transport system kinase
MALLDRFYKGEVQALSRLISEVENQSNGYQEIVSTLYPKTGKAYKLGITGPPGAGKSSLVDFLANEFVKASHKIGVIAVDPTSPFSGGAFLGDRVRMQSLSGKENIYIRSMASRGSLGGLAVTTFEACLILDAFGKDYIILETVGVGQIELEVAQHSDTVVVVLSPESGDSIQAFKAGLMEIGDIFVVNKADREGAARLVVQLHMSLETKRKEQRWEYPVLSTTAITGQGVTELAEAINKHEKFVLESDLFAKNRKRQLKNELQRVLENQIRLTVQGRFDSDLDWEKLAELIYEKEETPYSLADKILKSWRS